MFSAALFAVGAGALMLTVLMNMDLGKSLGLTEYGQQLQGASAVICDVFVVLSAVVAGVAMAKKRWVMMALASFLSIMFGCYSFSGVLGFGAKERIAKTRTAEKQQKDLIDATKQAVAEANKTRSEYVNWLKASTTDAEGKTTRAQFLGEASKIVMAPVEVKVPEIKVTLADPQAEVLSEFIGGYVSKDGMQRGLISSLAALLIICKMTAFFFGSALWPREAVKSEGSAAKAEKKVPEVETVAVPPMPAPAVAAPMEQSDKGAKALKATVDLTREREKRLVQEFFTAETMPVNGARVKGATVYEWFVEFVRKNHKGAAVITQTRFGLICSELGINKANEGRFVVYRGFQRRSLTAQKKIAA